MLINLFGVRVQKDKYELLRFVNSRHSIFLRLILGSLGFLFTAIITQSRPLAIQSFQDFKNDDFKISIRRAAKLLNIYKSQNVAKDDTFNFCEDLGISSLLALRKKFIAILSQNGFDLDNLGDYLYVLGGLIEHEDEKKYIDEYEKIANKIILVSTVAFVQNSEITEEKNVFINKAPKLKRHHAYSCLYDWSKLFPIEEMPWFVVSGTFLGLIREKNFLAHDYDIDFGVFDDNFDLIKLQKKLHKNKDFFIKKVDLSLVGNFKKGHFEFAKNKKPVLVKIVHRTGINIDLFVHYADNNHPRKVIWHGSSYHRWDNSPFKLKEYNFIDLPVLGPINYDKYLTENYGDWRTPVTDFHFTTGTPNLSIQNNPSSLALFLKRLAECRSQESHIKNLSVLQTAGYITKSGAFDLGINIEKK